MTDYAADLLGSATGDEGQAGTDYASELLGSTTPAAVQQKGPQPAQSGNMFQRAWETIKGKQDPKYAGVGAFDRHQASMRPGMAAALTGSMFVGQDDAAMGDIIQKHLGDKFIRRFKDANGYDLIEHMGDDGKPVVSYVNTPGLDISDITRGVVGSIPYIAAGGVVGAALKRAPLAFQVPAQAGTAASTSMVGDIIGMGMGSQRGIDPVKAGIAGTTAGVFQAVPSKAMAPIVGAVAGFGAFDDGEKAAGAGMGAIGGMAVNALARRFLGMAPGLYVNNGKLTPAGQKAAQEAGVDPATVNEEFAKIFADAYAKTRNGALAAAEAQAGAGPGAIRLSKGQREKDFQQMVLEDQMRAGLKGPQAKAVMDDFDRLQTQDITRAVRGDPMSLSGVGPRINLNWDGRSTADLGQSIRGGVETARTGARAIERQAWDEVQPFHAPDEALALLPQEIRSGLEKLGIPVNQNTPAASRMVELLKDYKAGKMPAAAHSPNAVDEFLPNFSGRNVDQTRRILRTMKDDAGTATDRAAAKAVYDAYNSWIEKSAAAGHFPPDVAGAMRVARNLSAEVKGMFEPRDGGQMTPAARRIADVMKEADSPEGVVSALFGRVGANAELPQGVTGALQNIKTSLARYAPETGRQTWDDIRLAYWQRITSDAQGNVLAPQALAKSIMAAAKKHGSAWSLLFSPTERAMIQNVAKGAEAAGYRPSNFRTNSSGSAYAGGSMLKDLIQTVWKSLAATPAISATAGAVLRPAQSGWYAARARQATGGVQEIMPTLGGYGGAAGSQIDRRQR